MKATAQFAAKVASTLDSELTWRRQKAGRLKVTAGAIKCSMAAFQFVETLRVGASLPRPQIGITPMPICSLKGSASVADGAAPAPSRPLPIDAVAARASAAVAPLCLQAAADHAANAWGAVRARARITIAACLTSINRQYPRRSQTTTSTLLRYPSLSLRG